MSSFFQEAKLFRRTGQSSFAVQVRGCPGVVEIHCTSVDLGHLEEEDSKRIAELGRELSPGFCHRHVRPAEGLEVELGPYSSKFKAFVQCKLRVVKRSGYEYSFSGSNSDEMVVKDSDSDSARRQQLPPVPKKRGDRRAFKWLSKS